MFFALYLKNTSVLKKSSVFLNGSVKTFYRPINNFGSSKKKKKTDTQQFFLIEDLIAVRSASFTFSQTQKSLVPNQSALSIRTSFMTSAPVT